MKKIAVVTFAIAAVIGFSHLASAQSVQLQAQNAVGQGGVQTNGFDLSIGEPKATRRACGIGASHIYDLYIDNGASHEQAQGAHDEYYGNCMCAKGWEEYCT